MTDAATEPAETPAPHRRSAGPHRRSAGPHRSLEAHRAILDAAETLLTEKGPAGVTFEAVARLAGAGKPTVYRWWPNRTALMLEVYDRRKVDALSRPDTGSLAEDLTILLRDLWRFWRDGPAGPAYAAIITDAQSDDAAKAAIAAPLNDPTFPLTPIFARALARGEIADPARAAVLREYVAAINWFRLLTGRLDEADIPELVTTLLDPRANAPR